MKEIMSLEGPVVDVVVLRQDGQCETVRADMTPSKNPVNSLLNGQATFIGQFEKLEVAIMKVRDPTPQHTKNAHVLPHPFNKREHRGDILLVRMNAASVPEHFTHAEYETFLKDAVFEGSCSFFIFIYLVFVSVSRPYPRSRRRLR